MDLRRIFLVGVNHLVGVDENDAGVFKCDSRMVFTASRDIELSGIELQMLTKRNGRLEQEGKAIVPGEDVHSLSEYG